MADIDEAGSKARGTYRVALAAVIILSVLLVAAILGVVAGFMRQYRDYQAGKAPAAAAITASGPAAAAATVQLAPGAHIVSAATDAGKLVLHVQTPGGAEVDVFDLATGRMTSQIKESP